MLKTLLKQVKQYKTASLLTPVFIMLEVVLDVLIPFVTAKLIDYGISAGHMPSVYKYGLIMIVMAFLSMMAVGSAHSSREGFSLFSMILCERFSSLTISTISG